MPGLRIDVWLPESEIAASLENSLAAGRLDERFFYWFPAGARAWIDLCASPAYRNAERATSILRTAAPELASGHRIPDRLCGLGCGDGRKDRLLLDAFEGRRPAFIAVDSSQLLLERAVAEAGAPARGLKLDLLDDGHLAALRGTGKTLYTVLGNTFGALDPRRFPRRIVPLLGPDDRLLVDGERFAGEETLRGYDHPDNRRFAFAPLAALGVGAADGDLRFGVRSDGDGLHAVTKEFVARRDLELALAGRPLRRLRAGERVRMSDSVKYGDGVLRRLLNAAGLAVEREWTGADGRFSLLLARR